MAIALDPPAEREYEAIKASVAMRVRRRLESRPPDQAVLTVDDEGWLREQVIEAVQSRQGPQQTSIDFKPIGDAVFYDFHPLGPLGLYLLNSRISELRVMGPELLIYIEDGEKKTAKLGFRNEEELRDKVVSFFQSRQSSRLITESQPMGTIVTPNGDRCHVVLSAVASPMCITIRRQQLGRFKSFQDLAEAGALPAWSIPFFKAVVNSRLNVLVAGGVGSGKTTFLRVFGSSAPENERVGTLEDDQELFLAKVRTSPDTFSLFTRQANAEGRGEVDMAMLVKEIKRMAPDRILVGEVRGAECLPMLDAMASGFAGSACTIHADAAEDTIPQLLRYMLQHPAAGRNEKLAIRSICSTIHLIVYLRWLRSPTQERRQVVDHVAAVYGFDEDQGVPLLERLIEYDENARGGFRWVGPRDADKLGNPRWRARFTDAGETLETLIPQARPAKTGAKA